MTQTKAKAAIWILLAIYYWVVLSRVFNFFLVHMKGELHAKEFREKRKTFGNK